MKRMMMAALMLLTAGTVLMAKDYTVSSPNGRLTAKIAVGKSITYSLQAGDVALVTPSAIAMKTDRGTWGEKEV